MAKFEKGQSGNPNGRPEGSKNKNAMRPVLWWNWFQQEVEKLAHADRIPQIKWAIEQMMPKVPVLPASPEDSKANASSALDELKAAEAYGNNGNAGTATAQPGSNGVDVATGQA